MSKTKKKPKHIKKLRSSKLVQDTISIPMAIYANKKTPIKALRQAAKKEYKDLLYHFMQEGHGWDLDYHIVISEIFYSAYGHHLEDYLLKRLAKSNLKLVLTSRKGSDRLFISKVK